MKKNDDVEIDYGDILDILSHNVLQIIESEAISQTEMADKLKTHQACISKVIAGRRDLRLINIYYIAVEYGINLNWLFGLSDEKYNRTARVFHNENLKEKMSIPVRARRNKI